MQQEMVRFRHGKSTAIPHLAGKVFAPLLKKMQQAVQQGIRTGELCNVDWMQVMYSILRLQCLLLHERAHDAPLALR